MGSSSASSRSDSIDNRVVGAPNGVTLGQGASAGAITVHSLDAKTIEQALGFAGLTLDNTGRILTSSISANEATTRRAMDTALEAQSAALGANVAITGDAFALLDRAQGRMYDSTADALSMGKHITDVAIANSRDVQDAMGVAVSMVADAYRTSGDQQATKSIADYRYLMIGLMAVVGIVGLQAVKS
jgi:hypothetical protein